MDVINNKKALYVCVYALLVLLLLYYVEQVMLLPYLIKTLIKFPLFTLVPWLFWHHVLEGHLTFLFDRKYLTMMLAACVVVVLSLLGVFVLVNAFIDIGAISDDFSNRMKIGRSTIVFAAVYTSVVNSLIEEYFFRGMLFLGLKKLGHRQVGYCLSSLFFALYHVTIFLQWFSWPIMLLALIGLVIGGLIFAWFADRTDSLISSWLIHITADALLMVLGLFVLGIG